MKNKIGVYICHCGGNVSDYVNVQQVRDIIEKEKGVALAKTTMFACADSTQKEIIDDIKNNQLDAIVIASCSPKLHLFTFRNLAQRAGLNPYNYVHVNVREQCSWAHSDNPPKATKKAIGLIRAGVARVQYSKALEPLIIPAINCVAVFGAGISGMRAAIELADMGSEVFLIENSHFVGGRTPQAGEVFSTGERGEEIVEKLYRKIEKNDKITLYTGAELISLSGSIGNFELKINLNPRYIKPDCDRSTLEDVINNCPCDIPDEFNFGLTKRKTIYKLYPGAFPDIPVADKKELADKGVVSDNYNKCIDLNQKPETISFKAGAILLSTGFDPYEPAENEYGYKKISNVITLHQLKRLLEISDNHQLSYNEKHIKNVVFIYCVGSRQTEGENKYCSRFCCTSAVHSALLLKKKFKDICNYHLFRDIRTYGKQELLFDESCRQGDIYLKFDAEQPPVVEILGNKTTVKVNDILTDGEEIEIHPDLVVLVTGMVPRKDSGHIAGLLKAPIGRDKFFNEVHPKLRPVETVINGIYISGTCQSPKNITETMKSSLSAASKANALIRKEEIKLDPILAKLDPEKCEWCDKCSAVCTYNTISKGEHNGKAVAVINEATCKGCGICSAVCPLDAIEITGYTNNEIESMINAIMEE